MDQLQFVFATEDQNSAVVHIAVVLVMLEDFRTLVTWAGCHIAWAVQDEMSCHNFSAQRSWAYLFDVAQDCLEAHLPLVLVVLIEKRLFAEDRIGNRKEVSAPIEVVKAVYFLDPAA